MDAPHYIWNRISVCVKYRKKRIICKHLFYYGTVLFVPITNLYQKISVYQVQFKLCHIINIVVLDNSGRVFCFLQIIILALIIKENCFHFWIYAQIELKILSQMQPFRETNIGYQFSAHQFCTAVPINARALLNGSKFRQQLRHLPHSTIGDFNRSRQPFILPELLQTRNYDICLTVFYVCIQLLQIIRLNMIIGINKCNILASSLFKAQIACVSYSAVGNMEYLKTAVSRCKGITDFP